MSIPIVTTALALALAACGATGTAQNVEAKGATQGGGSGASAEHTDDISVGVTPDAKAVKLLPAAVKAKGTLSVAMDLSYPPTTFMASDNKTPIGFNPDMSRLIAAKLGLKLQINNVKFDTIITGLQANRYDFTASTMGATSDRLKVLDMVHYVNSGTGVSVPYGNPQKLGTHTLCGHRVAVPSGSTAELQWLPQLSEQDCTSKGKSAIKSVTLPSVNDALTQLVSKRIDAVMYDFVSLEWAAAQQPKTFDVLRPLVATKPATVALKKDSPLTPAVQAAIQSIVDDPKYTEALSRWSLKDLGIKTAAMAVPQD
ncbi:ABC transporter substrate-binding protein [Streptomyces caniscabiei]|uniref:ABC transporter substrate-binding protein n=1 Tax=Streptomyces caniscabiei TaxID=2746961 RepID=UPI0029B82CE6|nr:ABC transporter substrate-binding protein [Streptomyces caniscabiei]MDX2600049.1 ABC transporter substrate-binding protein [Streptomyces caniscabiei]MDX2734658.1 ABC transporter substrate-binding protein [Streptomyces caniscabiei]MDX2777629.1 ABC transporter substrate-binding protein [Streptomyces caniscabiei]